MSDTQENARTEFKAEPAMLERQRKTSKNRKICCCCCGITSTVLVVLGLVGYFVIAPNMAQSNLDDSTLNITNGTVFHPKNCSEYPWAWQNISASMHNAAPFSVTLEKFSQTMTIFGDLTLFGGPNITNISDKGIEIAQFEFPEMHLKTGDNNITAKVNMTLLNQEKCGTSLTCFGLFETVVAMGAAFDVPAFVTVNGKDMHAKVFGVRLFGTYHKAFQMECGLISGDTGPKHPINVTNESSCIASGGCAPVATLTCWQVHGYTTTTTTAKPTTKTTAKPIMT
jgi:hypothetical protein